MVAPHDGFVLGEAVFMLSRTLRIDPLDLYLRLSRGTSPSTSETATNPDG